MLPVGLLVIVILCTMRVGTAHGQPAGAATKESPPATEARDRFHSLRAVAKRSVDEGRLEEAAAYARELLALAPTFAKDWDFGGAVHDGHLVLGRVALRRKDVESARAHLLQAGQTPGGPGLNTFGPNMSLAKDLLERGERSVVLEYFARCRKFWTMGGKDLDRWADDVARGQMPDFGPNLVY